MNRICPFEGPLAFLFPFLEDRARSVHCNGVSVHRCSQSGPQAPNRLTIGVALEGGGAPGLAHIGVSRLHIPIDYIAGNSVGSLVGGMYATGKSPDELKRLVKGMDNLGAPLIHRTVYI